MLTKQVSIDCFNRKYSSVRVGLLWNTSNTCRQNSDGIRRLLNIVTKRSERPIVATEALDYELENYTDWSFPSKEELLEMLF